MSLLNFVLQQKALEILIWKVYLLTLRKNFNFS